MSSIWGFYQDRNPLSLPVTVHAAVSRSQTLPVLLSEGEPVGRVNRGEKIFRGIKRKKVKGGRWADRQWGRSAVRRRWRPIRPWQENVWWLNSFSSRQELNDLDRSCREAANAGAEAKTTFNVQVLRRAPQVYHVVIKDHHHHPDKSNLFWCCSLQTL